MERVNIEIWSKLRCYQNNDVSNRQSDCDQKSFTTTYQSFCIKYFPVFPVTICPDLNVFFPTMPQREWKVPRLRHTCGEDSETKELSPWSQTLTRPRGRGPPEAPAWKPAPAPAKAPGLSLSRLPANLAPSCLRWWVSAGWTRSGIVHGEPYIASFLNVAALAIFNLFVLRNQWEIFDTINKVIKDHEYTSTPDPTEYGSKVFIRNKYSVYLFLKPHGNSMTWCLIFIYINV